MADTIPKDHNLRVEGVSRGARALITRLENAAMEYAFVGSAPPEDRTAILEHAQQARYDLEAWISRNCKGAS